MSRVLACGDLHCGHVAGLTPPDWRIPRGRHPALHRLQERGWADWLEMVKAVGPVDVAIVNGDLIDGPGDKSGGTEELTTDPLEQVDMAVAALAPIKPRRGWVFTYGTAYHTGTRADYETGVARAYGASIGSHEWCEVDGVIFDCKHHVGGSQVPHGRHTAVARDRLWNLLWSEHGEQPRAAVYIRSHVHYHGYSGGPGWLAMTLPALQQAHTKFGGRRCSGTVDWGFVTFATAKGEVTSWQAHVVRHLAAASALKKL